MRQCEGVATVKAVLRYYTGNAACWLHAVARDNIAQYTWIAGLFRAAAKLSFSVQASKTKRKPLKARSQCSYYSRRGLRRRRQNENKTDQVRFSPIKHENLATRIILQTRYTVL